MARMQKTKVGMEPEISALAKLLESLPAAITFEERRDILEEAAQPMVKAAKSIAPRSKKTHYWYAQGHKLSGKLKAPPGKGKVVAKFEPGTLSESIDILRHGPFKKTPHVYIGPRYPRRMSMRSRLKAAPYAHMVEFGTVKQKAQPYMRPAFDITKNITFNLARVKFGRLVDKWRMKNK